MCFNYFEMDSPDSSLKCTQISLKFVHVGCIVIEFVIGLMAGRQTDAKRAHGVMITQFTDVYIWPPLFWQSHEHLKFNHTDGGKLDVLFCFCP